ncbi:Ti-type conjugative transfer system protein TraG [Ancylobacter sp. FA202]|uniref:Ti-type conjugative transfer system protein TraG n=1 Tax=Ancylobacter sp. FA202 TaxID=1111106 RepID=UPI000477C140|nr:Ti-type conjugative transfer system protein TraG [Ancylobacter sp. FA202]
MHNINWKDPTLAWALLPASVLALCIFVTDTMWPALAADLTGQPHYWFMRSSPLVNFILPPLFGLAVVALLPRHKRMPLALINLLLVVGVGLAYAWREYARLAPYAEQGMSFNELSGYISAFVIGGSVVAFGLAGFGARLSTHVPDRVRRVKGGMIGDADWMDLGKAQKLFPTDGEIVLGEAYRADKDVVAEIDFEAGDRASWGKGGKEPLLCFRYGNDSGHLLFFAGSGGFKTTANVIPTGLTYREPIVCFDPSTEIAPMLVKARRDMNPGRRVFVLDPTDPTVGFNVLDWIETSSRKEEDIAAVAHMLLAESGKIESSTGSYFQNQAHNLLTGILAYILLSPNFEGEKTLRSLRQLVSRPEPSFIALLREIVEDEAEPDFVRESLGVFTNMTEQTFSGVYSTASKDTQWLSLGNYASLVCGDTFTTADLARGKIDLFLNLRMDTLKSYPGIGRVIIGALLNAMIQADGRSGRRVLFLVDEASLLGYMKLLEEARDRGRKYGISLMLFYQSVGQIEGHFGRAGAQAWFESAALTSYAAVGTHETAKRLSDLCGEMTIEVGSSSRQAGLLASSARATESVNYQRRALILPHEILQDMRRDDQIIIKAGQRPLRCGRAIYFRRPDMVARTEANRFAPKGGK